MWSDVKFGPVIQQKMSFYYISYLELELPSCSVEQNHLCNFRRGHHGANSCEVIWHLDKWYSRRCLFITFLIWSSSCPLVQSSKTIYAILKEGIIGLIHVKLYEIWTSGSGGDVVNRHFLSIPLATPLFSGLEPFLQFWKKALWAKILWNYFEFGSTVQKEMPFQGITYLALWQLLCLVDWNHLGNFGRRHYEEKSCEIILNLDQRFRRKWRLKVFIIWSSGCPPVQWIKTIYVILKEGITGNIHVKLCEIWTSGTAEDVFLLHFLSGARVALLFSRAKPFMQF